MIPQICQMYVPHGYKPIITMKAVPLLTCFGILYIFKKYGQPVGYCLHHALCGTITISPKTLISELNISCRSDETKCVMALPDQIYFANTKDIVAANIKLFEDEVLGQNISVIEDIGSCFTATSQGIYGIGGRASACKISGLSVNEYFTATIDNIDSVEMNKCTRIDQKFSRLQTWTPDSESDTCMCCAAKIKPSFISSNKHHCRMCGNIICFNCTENLKETVRLLAYKGFHRQAISNRLGISVGSVEQIISTCLNLVQWRKQCKHESKRRRYKSVILRFIQSRMERYTAF